MKIVILGTAYPYRGGLAAFNERMAKELVAEGHDVQILTFTLQYPAFLFPGKTQYSESPAPSDLSITRCVNSINPLNWIRIGRRLRRERPDLLVIKYWLPLMAPCFGTIARIARRNGHTQVVSVLDNVIPHEPHFWDKWLTRYFVSSADRFIAMSDSVERDLRLFTNKPCTLARHPIYDNFGQPLPPDEAKALLGIADEKINLLFFGIIRDYKGLDLLLRAFADPRIDKSRVRLIVAGEFYNNAEQYEHLLDELQLRGAVLWHTHFIADEQVVRYFSAADLIVQPYKSATQSGVTQIAYHFERPMLVTNVGGLAEIVPNGRVGYVTEVREQAIADAIVDFVSNPSPDRFAAGIAEEKKKYAWSTLTHKLINL